MNPIICLFAPKESGKTTVADLIVRRGYVPIAFADPVRDGVAAAFGLDRDWFREVSSNQNTKEIPLDELGGRTPREMLVQFGMYFRDEVSETHWADVAVRRIQDTRARGRRVVVTDCRFENEAQAVQNIGGIVIGIQRPESWKPNTQDRAEAAVYSGWNRVVDLVLHNDGDLEQLTDAVRDLSAQTFRSGDQARLRNGGEPVGLLKNMDDEGYFLARYLGVRTGTFHRSELRSFYPDVHASDF